MVGHASCTPSITVCSLSALRHRPPDRGLLDQIVGETTCFPKSRHSSTPSNSLDIVPSWRNRIRRSNIAVFLLDSHQHAVLYLTIRTPESLEPTPQPRPSSIPRALSCSATMLKRSLNTQNAYQYPILLFIYDRPPVNIFPAH